MKASRTITTKARPSGKFVRIGLARENAPDATTLLKFLRLFGRRVLTRTMFDVINAHLAEQGPMLREGTIVNATLIAAPPSMKNRENTRDPEMEETNRVWIYKPGEITA